MRRKSPMTTTARARTVPRPTTMKTVRVKYIARVTKAPALQPEGNHGIDIKLDDSIKVSGEGKTHHSHLVDGLCICPDIWVWSDVRRSAD